MPCNTENLVNTCPNCKRTVNTTKGLCLYLHLSFCCQAYQWDKLKHLRVDCSNRCNDLVDKEVIAEDAESPRELAHPAHEMEVDPGEVVEDFHDHLFDFIPQDSEQGIQNSEVEGNCDISSVSAAELTSR